MLFGYFAIPPAQAALAGNNIIITEVLYDTPGTDGDEEWFELFNPTPADINVTNWKVSDNYANYTLPNATVVSGGYLTVAKLTAGFNALYGYDPDIDGLDLFFGNSGDQCVLYDADNNTIDLVAWEDYLPGWDVSAVHTSIRRVNETDTDTVGDWEDSATIGDPGFGTYVVIIPEFTKSTIGIIFLLFGILTFVGLSYRKKK